MLLVCLAKSRKHGGRCIAGVEVIQGSSDYEVVRKGAEPCWVRPVADTEHGEVPSHLVESIALLDVVEFPDVQAFPQGCQSENARIGKTAPYVVGKLPKTRPLLDRFQTVRSSHLFGNRGKAVIAEQAARLDHSSTRSIPRYSAK